MSFISTETPKWLLSGWFALLLNGVAVLCLFGGVWLGNRYYYRLRIAALYFVGVILMTGSVIIDLMRFH